MLVATKIDILIKRLQYPVIIQVKEHEKAQDCIPGIEVPATEAIKELSH